MTEVSKEYGTALFMLACEYDKKEEYAKGLSVIREAFAANPDYREFLSSPSIALSERLSAIDEVFSSLIAEDVVSFLKLLCEKGRASCFLDSVKEYNALLDASKKVTKVKVLSAVELTVDEKKRMEEMLEKKFVAGVEADYEIDKSLIGGVIIEADGKIIDGSIRSRLQDVKEVINR